MMSMATKIATDMQQASAVHYHDARELFRVFLVFSPHSNRWRTARLDARWVQKEAARQSAIARRVMDIET
jgi:hypothetical protein